MRLNDFFNLARKRHRIYLDRLQGELPPWTEDPILAEYRFCNVFRELDKNTIWYRTHIREKLLDDEKSLLIATLAYRWFNKIETAEIIEDLFFDWDGDEALKRLNGRSPVITGAYIIKTPNGMTKLNGVLWCIQQCVDNIDELHKQISGASLEDATKALCEMPYMGPFMAYEVITDLRHTSLLMDAPDILTWANPGPGCRRGMSRLNDLDVQYYASGKEAELMKQMRKVLAASKDKAFWPVHWPEWEMREVEHWLCEYDKYSRALNGEGRPKQKYQAR